MTPTILYARLGNTTELKCSVHYRGYAWSSINIAQQNKSGSFLLLNVSSNGNVESKTTRINGSVTKDDDYINVTVSFDASPGSGVCELNQTYSCDIQLIDSSIGTIAANSTLILESKYTLHWLNLKWRYNLLFDIMSFVWRDVQQMIRMFFYIVFVRTKISFDHEHALHKDVWQFQFQWQTCRYTYNLSINMVCRTGLIVQQTQ